jgi:hypothetical protein
VAADFFFSPEHIPNGTSTAIRDMALGDGALEAWAQSAGTTHGVATVDGRKWLNASTWTLGGNWWSAPVRGTPLTVLTVGMRVIYGGTRDEYLFRFMNPTNGTILDLHCTAAGVLTLRRGATVLATGTTTLSALQEIYLELEVTLDATVGAFKLVQNGSEVLMEGSGENTQNNTGGCARIRMSGGGQTTGDNAYIRDIYIKPGGGFYGPVVVRKLDLDADISTEWTPDSGTENYSRLTGVNSAASYVESETLGDTDVYGVEDLPAGINSIIAVVPFTVGVAPDGGAPQVKLGLVRGADTAAGEERTVGVGGARTQQVAHMTQPNTTPWSIAAVNEIRMRMESA